jgi:hypothetical protein
MIRRIEHLPPERDLHQASGFRLHATGQVKAADTTPATATVLSSDCFPLSLGGCAVATPDRCGPWDQGNMGGEHGTENEESGEPQDELQFIHHPSSSILSSIPSSIYQSRGHPAEEGLPSAGSWSRVRRNKSGINEDGQRVDMYICGSLHPPSTGTDRLKGSSETATGSRFLVDDRVSTQFFACRPCIAIRIASHRYHRDGKKNRQIQSIKKTIEEPRGIYIAHTSLTTSGYSLVTRGGSSPSACPTATSGCIPITHPTHTSFNEKKPSTTRTR